MTKRKTDRFYDNVAYWTIPPGIQRFFGKFVQCIRQKRHQPIANSDISQITLRNLELKDRHKGERCFILATGPSINQQDLTILKGELCIAVSHFFLHRDIQIINPRYHVLAPYHPPFGFKELNNVFDGFEKKYTNNVSYLFGHNAYEFSIYNFLKKHSIHAYKKSYFVDYSNSHPLNSSNFRDPSVWDLTKSPFCVRTVIYAAIQSAAYMGCKEIYLIGCDHDYLQDLKRVSDHHFYREEDGVSDVEHLSAFTSERWFEEYYFRWQQYRLIKEYLNECGVKIENATKGGMLDVFPRADLESLF